MTKEKLKLSKEEESKIISIFRIVEGENGVSLETVINILKVALSSSYVFEIKHSSIVGLGQEFMDLKISPVYEKIKNNPKTNKGIVVCHIKDIKEYLIDNELIQVTPFSFVNARLYKSISK